MVESGFVAKSARLKSRQSIGHFPSKKTSAMKDNATTDISALHAQQSPSQSTRKRTRGKSLGPGGLEALNESSGNLAKPALALQIKSILKPTIPLTPPKAIPTFDELRKRSTGKRKSPATRVTEDLLIDFSTPAPNQQDALDTSLSGLENVADPFSPIKQASPGKQETGVLENELDLKRQAEKKAILERRAARRKSMANRRVSFAPEATLHTWSVMELAEDSTTSSASNSTRRQSSMTAAQSPVKPIPSPAASVVPSSPEATGDVPDAQPSPGRERSNPRQDRRRRGSAFPVSGIGVAPDDVLSSSPSGDVTTNSSPIRIEEGIEPSDDSDSEGDTAMSLDDGTITSIRSQDSSSSTHSSLEDRLRQASHQAGTRGIDYDELDDEESMEIATATVTNALQPWARNRHRGLDNTAMLDQENLAPAALTTQNSTADAALAGGHDDQTEEMSMDLTRAVGGIVFKQTSEGTTQRSPKSRRKSSVRRRRSSRDESSYGETMEFTTVQGGILNDRTRLATIDIEDMQPISETTFNEQGNVASEDPHHSTISDSVQWGESAMDMTMAVGGILPPAEEDTDEADDQTMAMDMTRAIGAIVSRKSPSSARASRASNGQSMSAPADTSNVSPISTPKSQQHLSSVASETGSPILALKSKPSAQSDSSASKTSITRQSMRLSGTPVKSPGALIQGTPSKQITPLPPRAETPNKTPLSSNVTQRGASPKKLFRSEIKARSSPASVKREASLKTNNLFSRDLANGQRTPSIVLRATQPKLPQPRSTGIGVDREGVGSPRVSQMLDRRKSISDVAPQFRLGSNETIRVDLEDLAQIENEVEADRAEDQRRESGKHIMEQEANGPQDENTTIQLKHMIQEMSPKKPKSSKLRGRKSLAVGGAKGLLGKRPAELDLDDEDEADSTPKRLKAVSREGSPVKKIHLPKPPSKDETTGKLNTKVLQALDASARADTVTPTLGPLSPAKSLVAASPSTVGRFRNVEKDGAAKPTSFEEKLDNVIGAIDISTAKLQEAGSDQCEQEKISLQQFLNMTNIHFIELSATRRRHTIAQSLRATDSSESATGGTQARFVAAATTLPLLELYQHATRELKSYISAGRKIVRSIEAETLAEQPALFRDYVDARPDVKLVMDNQFRNGKANARLQSKEGWYQWRGQLIDGLRVGLEGIQQNMLADLELLTQQQNRLEPVVADLLSRQVETETKRTSLRQSLHEVNCLDQDALDSSRQQLQQTDDYYLRKSTLLATLQQQMKEKEEALEAGSELMTEMHDQIAEADRVKEEHKGWPAADVKALKSKVDALEKTTAWSLVSVEEHTDELDQFGAAVIMVYKNDLRLFFYPRVFQCNAKDAPRRRSGRKSASVSGPTAPISLAFAPVHDEYDAGVPRPELPTEKRFFLQLVQSQLHAFSMMPKGSIPARTLTSTVSQGWDLACKISKEVRFLNLVGITEVSILNDEKLGIKTLLVVDKIGRVDVQFSVCTSILNDGQIVASTTVSATAIYGPSVTLLTGPKAKKVQNALGKEANSRALGAGAWASAARGLEQWTRSQLQGEDEAKKSAEASPPPMRAPAAAPVPPSIAVPPESPTPARLSTSQGGHHAAKRSPLAPKRANVLQKKALPISKQRLEKLHLQPQPSHAKNEKENVEPVSNVVVKMSGQTAMNDWAEDSHVPEPAITPDMQEVMMQTPIKRIGALRRSPM